MFSLFNKYFYYIPLMTIPSCKSILISWGASFDGFFFLMDHLIGLSSKNYEIPTSLKNLYMVLHLHCFT